MLPIRPMVPNTIDASPTIARNDPARAASPDRARGHGRAATEGKMRRFRDLGTPRRRPQDLPGALRPAAPRAGVLRYRGDRRPPARGLHRDGPGVRGLRRAG